MRDYESEKEAVKALPVFYLGEEVETPGGRGVIVKLEMPSNGLYLEPERSGAVVWFGTANSKRIEPYSGKWGQFLFGLNEIKKITPEHR